MEKPDRIECLLCGEFVEPGKLGEHESKHSLAEVYAKLDAKLTSKLDAVSESLGNTTADLIGKLAVSFDERMKQIESKEAGAEKSEEPREVLMGEEGREARVKTEAAKATATELERRGWNRREISDFVAASGPFMQGLSSLIIAAKGPSSLSPFHEAGQVMFTTFTKVMTEQIARGIGRRAAAEATEHE